MSQQAIILYLHVHQPYRLRHYTVFDISRQHNYFDTDSLDDYDNTKIIRKVCQKSYLPTNRKLLGLLNRHDDFKLNLSMSGTVIEQLEKWAPETLESFKELFKTGRVELVGETYHHSLAFFYSLTEFEAQVKLHADKVQQLFNLSPAVLRNTELAYNNDLGGWAEARGYKGILAEGWDPILGWRSSNFVYRPINTSKISLFLKNYRLSDDIAFRFGDQTWSEWPLTADKFNRWLNQIEPAQVFNLFMDYETFGEHQWEDKGIFEFLEHFPSQWLANDRHTFMTFSEAIKTFEPADAIDIPQTVTWADTERDLTAWLGNPMQQQAIKLLYDLSSRIKSNGDDLLLNDWRRLQASDHFYYMCTKWFADGDVHAYFSPYQSPYEAFLNFMNVYHDLNWRSGRRSPA